jgi:hypothetical protein
MEVQQQHENDIPELASLVQHQQQNDEEDNEFKKQGNARQLFFGYYCDTRQAVIITSILSFIGAFSFVVYLILHDDEDISNTNDESLIIQSISVVDSIVNIFSVLFIPTWIIVPFFGIYGAWKYSIYCVAIHMVFYITLLMIALIDIASGFWINFGYVILCLLFIYPNAVFIMQVRDGLITRGK